MPKGRRKIVVAETTTAETVAVATTPICPLCHKPTEVNDPAHWVNEQGNEPDKWWNNMPFYCPTDLIFMYEGDTNRYTQPAGRTLDTGRTIITLTNEESAMSQPMSEK